MESTPCFEGAYSLEILAFEVQPKHRICGLWPSKGVPLSADFSWGFEAMQLRVFEVSTGVL